MAKVRSEYIKKLVSESNSLEAKLQEVAETTINSILEEKTKTNLRTILAEDDENSFSEEEVEDTPEADVLNTPKEDGADEEGSEGSEWDDLEQYKDEDGEYDLRSLDKEELVKILKVMKPDDAVRIVKNDDESLTVTDETKDEEFELNLDDFTDEETESDEDEEIEIDLGGDEDDDVIEIELDDDTDEDEEIEIELDESDLGYTDDYQKQTAMTTPSNHEPANPKTTYSMDGGVPTDTKKPWAGNGDNTPFEDEVNESGGEFGKVQARLATKQHRNNSNGQGGQPYGSRNNSVAGEFKGYEESVSESIKKKANQIFKENKQLKALMGKLQNQVNEAIVVNQSLANVIKLINENSTTVNEKKDILRRFNECTTREESNKLYTTISEELKRDSKTYSNVAENLNSQLSESANRTVETPMYQSQDLSETLSFMQRLNAIK